MRFLASQAIKGRTQAAAVAAAGVMAGLMFPPLGLIGAAAVALITLRNGMRAGAEVILLGALLCGLFLGIATGNPSLGVFLALPGWLPLWGVAGVLRSTRSLPLAQSAATLMGVLLLGLLWGTVGGAETWLEALAPTVKLLEENAGATTEQAQAVVALFAGWMNGALAVGLILQTMLALLLGRWWQALLFNPGGFRGEFQGLRLSRIESLLALGSLGWLVLAPGEPAFGDHLALVLVTGFFLHGLALCHRMVGGRPGGRLWLTGIYLLLPFMIIPTATALVVAGIADAWLDFRSRLAQGSGSGPAQ